MESSIEEQVQTAADDSFRSDSIPSLPDEKGNFVYTYMYNYLCGEASRTLWDTCDWAN